MQQMMITTEIIPKDQILKKLEEHRICINRYAEEWIFKAQGE